MAYGRRTSTIFVGGEGKDTHWVSELRVGGWLVDMVIKLLIMQRVLGHSGLIAK